MAKSLTVVPPSQAKLRSSLGKSFYAWQRFLADNSDLRPEWKYYGAKGGWTLKLFEKRRNLCFMHAHESEFTIAFLLGAKAVEAALASLLSESVKQEIREARTYVEGRPVHLTIRKLQDLKPAAILLDVKRSN